MTAADFQRKYHHFQVLGQQHQQILAKHGDLKKHPWYGLMVLDLSPIDQGDLLGCARMWRGALETLQETIDRLGPMVGVSAPCTLGAIGQLQQQLAQCPAIGPTVETSLLPMVKTPQAQDLVQTLAQQLKHHRQQRATLQGYFREPPEFFPQPLVLRGLRAKLSPLNLPEDPDYAIANLLDFSEHTATIAHQCEQHRPLVAQVAGFFELDQLPTLDAIAHMATAVEILAEQTPEILQKRTAELCRGENRQALETAQATAENLRALQGELNRHYDLDGCDGPDQMNFYGQKLREGNLVIRWFDGDYRKAKKLWARIQRQASRRSVAEIAQTFENIAQFQTQLHGFLHDPQLRKICGADFQGLETDFQTLLAVNCFSQRVAEHFGDRPQGDDFARFLLTAHPKKTRENWGTVPPGRIPRPCGVCPPSAVARSGGRPKTLE